MRTGAYNFDIRLDTNREVVIMEVSPRNGGAWSYDSIDEMLYKMDHMSNYV